LVTRSRSASRHVLFLFGICPRRRSPPPSNPRPSAWPAHQLERFRAGRTRNRRASGPNHRRPSTCLRAIRVTGLTAGPSWVLRADDCKGGSLEGPCRQVEPFRPEDRRPPRRGRRAAAVPRPRASRALKQASSCPRTVSLSAPRPARPKPRASATRQTVSSRTAAPRESCMAVLSP